MSYYSKPSTFHVSVLTDMVGTRSYVACLSFHESFTYVRRRDDFDSAINVSGDASNSSPVSKTDVQMEAYYPKCLCLVSKFTYFDILKV